MLGKRLDAVDDSRGKLSQRTFARDKKTADLSLCLHVVSALRSLSNAQTVRSSSDYCQEILDDKDDTNTEQFSDSSDDHQL